MAQKLDGGIPDGMDLDQNWKLVFAAVDPTTGAAVAGVTISSVGILVKQLAPGSPSDLNNGPFKTGPFMLVPGPGA